MRTRRMASILLFAALGAASASHAGIKDAAKPQPAVAQPARTAPGGTRGLMGVPASFTLPGVPAWKPPAEYRVDMVMSSGKEAVTMQRFFRGDDIRTEIAVEDQKIVMLERGDEPGTTYTLMPEQKMVMKMNQEAIAEQAPPEMKEQAAKAAKAATDVTPEIEKLGTEKLEGRDAAKFKVSADGHSALMWFDAATGAPLRMESADARIEWKNFEAAAQPAKLFEVPKDWQVMDMAEHAKQMRAAMGGAAMGGGMPTHAGAKGMRIAGGGKGAVGSAMAGLGGGAGLPGGVPGMGSMSVEGMAGQYGQSMGSNLGQQMGASIGASFGGPLGAIAGGFIGGKVGGWLGHRAATAVTPDIGPGSGR